MEIFDRPATTTTGGRSRVRSSAGCSYRRSLGTVQHGSRRSRAQIISFAPAAQSWTKLQVGGTDEAGMGNRCTGMSSVLWTDANLGCDSSPGCDSENSGVPRASLTRAASDARTISPHRMAVNNWSKTGSDTFVCLRLRFEAQKSALVLLIHPIRASQSLPPPANFT